MSFQGKRKTTRNGRFVAKRNNSNLQNKKKYYGLGGLRSGYGRGRGEEEDDDEEEEMIGGRGNPIYKKHKDVVHRANPAFVTYPWANFWVNTNRYRITSFSILAILVLFVLFIMWFPLQIIPAMPSSLFTRYGAFEYLIWAGIYPINILIGYLSDRTTFYSMGCIINTLAFVTYSLLWLVIVFSFIRCHTGELPQSCTDNYLIDSIVFLLTSLLVLASMCTTFCYVIVARQTSGTQDPVAYKLTPK